MVSRIFTHLVLVLGLFSAVSLKAQQVTFTISPSMVTPAVGDTVRLNVVVTNFTNIVSFQYAMDWDANLFQFVTIDNKDNMPDKQNLDFNNYTPSAVIVGWSAVGGAQRSAPNGTVIYRLNLKVKAASSNYWAKFTRDGTSLEVIQAGQSVTPVFGNLGNPPGGASTALTIKTSTHSIQASQSVCVGVTADNFTNIEVAQWQMKWDSTVLRFDSLTKMNTTLGLSVSSHFGTTQAVTNGRLYFSWNSAPPKSVPNGDTLYKICFKGIGAVGSSTPVSTLTENSEVYRSNSGSSTLIAITPQNGTVNIAAPTTTTGLAFSGTTVSGNIGDTVCVKVYVKNFKDIAIAGFSMHWDSTKLSFGKAHVLNPQYGPQDSLVLPNPLIPPTTTYSSPNNVFVYKTTASGSLVMFADLSGLNNGNGVTLLGDSSLVFDVCLRINSGAPGSSFPFTFNGVPFKVQILDKDVNKIPVTFVSGNININNVVVPAIVESGSITNANCKNGSDGSVTLTVSGGTGTFGYSWTGPSFTSASKNITALKAGKYFVTITSGSATPKVDSFTVTEPTIISTTKTSANVNCFGQATGSVTLTPAGGTAPYIYAWSSGETSKDIANKAAGRYIVTISDSKSCSIKDTTDITQPAAAISLTNAVSNVTCNGASTGAINLTVAGGTPPYTYSWTGPNGFTASTEDISNLKAGGYSVTVTDSKSCAQTMGPINVIESAAITATPSVTSATCGQLNGAISIAPAGGTAPYTYKWTGPNGYTATTQNISGLAAGSYSVEITDAAGCKMTLPAISVSSANPTFSLSNVVTNVLCNGGSTGAIVLTVTGGNGNFAYAWTGTSSFTATTKDISNLKAGAYNVDVTENGTGCKVVASAINVTEPTAISLGQPQKTDVKCKGGSTGTASISASGGTGSFTYSWTGPNGFTASNTSAISNLIAGTYTVVVKDANNCSATTSVIIGEPSTAVAIGTPSVTNVLCKGASTGSIVISVQGGTSPYTFLWSNGSTQQNLSNIAAGNYTVTVKDANSCTVVSSSIPVGEPAAAIAVTPSVTNASCGQLNGAINITPSGGTAPYTFKWTGPNGYTSTSQNIANLAAGGYTVEITDASACKFTSNAITVISTNATFSLSNTVTNISCNGSNNGIIVLNVTGGNGNFTYAWTGSNAFTATTKDISNLKPGSYNVNVTETGTGCQVAASAISVTESAAVSISVTQKTDVKCKDDATGSISVSAAGGNGGFNYSWSGPNGFTASNTSSISNLKAGTYSVTATDTKGCTANTSVTIIEPSTKVTIGTPSVVNVLCNGASTGSINITVQGGTGPYTFAWSNGSTQQNLSNIAAGNYVVIVTDANGCKDTKSIDVTQPNALIISGTTSNSVIGCVGTITLSVTGGIAPYSYSWVGSGITNPNDPNQSNLCPNEIYTVTVKDANQCTSTKQFTITGQIAPPIRLTDSTVVSQAGCPGQNLGAINIAFIGGKAPFSFEWMNSTGAIIGREQNIKNLVAGKYRVKIIDMVGQSYLSGEIIIKESASTINIAVSSTKSESCIENDGEIKLNVTGGSPLYKYIWSDGPTSQDRLLIKAGSYSVTVSDATACLSNKNGIEVKKTPCSLTLSSANKPAACFGDKNGSITINIQNGEPTYVVRWSANDSVRINNLPRRDGTYEIKNLAAGTYVISITDGNGQMTTLTETVREPTEIVITKTVKNDAGNCSGSIVLAVSGGMPPYSYIWNDGATSRDRFNLCANSILSVQVTDSKGCFKSTPNDTIKSMIEPTTCGTVRINTNFDGFNLKCFGDKNGSASVVTVTDLSITAPFQYVWDNGETGPTAFQLAAGARTVRVLGANGRSCIANFVMKAPDEIKVNVIPNTEGCSLETVVRGGVAPFKYEWSTPKRDTSVKITGLSSQAKYFVIVKDKYGCTTDPGIGTAECKEYCLKGPGVLTPNDDGKNDKFDIEKCDYKNVRLQVFNRWGQIAYENNDYTDQWEGYSKDGKDGKELPEGVYMFVIRALQANGIEKIEKSTVSILRQ